MNRPTESREGLYGLLRRELALDRDRWRAIARIALGAAIVVAITTTFRLPLAAYAAYLVFLVSRDDKAATLMTAIGGLAAATLAVGLTLLLYVFDAAEPAVRLPLLAVATFAGCYFARTSPLGPVSFLAGFVLVLSQTLVDEAPAVDLLTHTLLWLWVVVALPVAVTVLIHGVIGENPVTLARRRALDAVEWLAHSIERPTDGAPSRFRAALVALAELTGRATRWDARLKAVGSEDRRMIALLLEIMSLSRGLPTSLSQDARTTAASAIREAGLRFMQRRTSRIAAMAPVHAATFPPTTDPNVQALTLAIGDLRREAEWSNPSRPATMPSRSPPRNVAMDRGSARFAAKVMFAVLASYATYALLDWPGIRTAVTTCFFVSLTSLGESVHKFTLRATGAIGGGLLAGVCIVYVLPLLTDVGQLCLVIAVVSAFAAWISTGSDTIAYAGMQIAFAFFLGVLQGFAPADDLTVLRDRVVGILIGNAWVTLVFTSLWPVSAIDEAHARRCTIAADLANALADPASPLDAERQLRVQTRLAEADVLDQRAPFEGRPLDDTTVAMTQARLERIVTRVDAIVRLRAMEYSTTTHPADRRLAMQLRAMAEGHIPGPSPSTSPMPSATPLDAARRALQEELDHAWRT